MIYRPTEISPRFAKERFWAEKAFAPSVYDIVFTGDSRTYRAISPNEIKKAFSDTIKVLNFGFSAAGLNNSFINASINKFSPQSKNKILVLGVTPFSLTKEAQSNDHLVQESKRTTMDKFDRLYIGKYLSVFEPTTLSFFIKRLSGNKNGYYETFNKDGWIGSAKTPSDTMEAYYSYKKRFSESIIESTVLDSLFATTKQLQKEGIHVFAYRPPTTKVLRTLEDSIMKFDQKAFIKNFEQAGGTWIDIPDSMYFYAYDGSHLDQKSAILLSDFLGKKIKQYSK